MELNAFEKKAVQAVKGLKLEIAQLKARVEELEKIGTIVEALKDELIALRTNPASRRFTPPTMQELENYFGEYKRPDMPQRFWDFYNSKGWMIGKNKMANWKSAAHKAMVEWDRSNPALEDKKHSDVLYSANERRANEVIESARRHEEMMKAGKLEPLPKEFRKHS